jgi:hypothetical protein
MIQDASTLPKLKLIEATNMKVKYVALSYRWFAEPTLKLTTANQLALQKEIPWSALPAIFHDAVSICSAFDFQYFWIDSLCILQDSSLDWDVESSCMQDVYRNASLVIGASLPASAGTEVGFLGPRKGHYIRSVGELSVPQKTDPLTIYMTPYLRHSRAATAEDPLSYRGWAYQERLLARRFLAFNPHEMMWQCEDSEKCECGMLDDLPFANGGKHDYSLQGLLYRSKEEVYRAWTHQVVDIYSKRVLTYDSDKLPALSGAVQFFHEKLQDDYLAGLWKGDLLSGLRWGTLPSTLTNQYPAVYRAPSWSWASTNIEVAYPNSTFFKVFATVVDAKCDTAEGFPFGRVSGGHVTLKAPLAEAWIRFPRSGIIQNPRYVSLLTGSPEVITGNWMLWPDSTLSTEVDLTTLSNPTEVCVQRVNHQVSVPDYDERTASFSVKVWCLCIGLTEDSNGDYKETVGLVLSRSSKNRDHFVRLGKIKQLALGTEQPFKTAKMQTVTIV